MIKMGFRWERGKIWKLPPNKIPHLQELKKGRPWQIKFFLELCETGEDTVYVQVLQFLDALGMPDFKNRGISRGVE